MAKVIVLAGGKSDEREVSLRSGAAVAKALKTAGHEASELDPGDGWDNILPQLQAADVVFPALHGKGGEDGELQAYLEKNNIRYVGPDSKASALCFDKARYTQLMKDHGILVPQTELVNLQGFQNSALSKKPFVLKPNDGGSSIDTFIVREINNSDDTAIAEAFTRYNELLLQELIEGVEITVAILGEQPLPVIEIIPPEDGEFDYENKYNGQTQELCPPKHVSGEQQAEAQSIAKKVHDLTGCRHMSRTDIIITPGHQHYVLETNTIPGLTDESLLPKAAGEISLDMPAMCDKLVQLALQQ